MGSCQRGHREPAGRVSLGQGLRSRSHCFSWIIVSVTNAGGFGPTQRGLLIIRVWEPSEKQDYIVREGGVKREGTG